MKQTGKREKKGKREREKSSLKEQAKVVQIWSESRNDNKKDGGEAAGAEPPSREEGGVGGIKGK